MRRLTPTLTALCCFALQIPFLRLDFDRHHDGYMLNPAIAVHDGAKIHSEIASQYGPLTTWTQSWFLNLPTSPALALRIWAAVLVSVLVFLIANLGSGVLRQWGMTSSAACAAAGLYFALSPHWMGITPLPWSSLLAGCLGMISAHLFALSVQRGPRHLPAIASGVFVGLLPFARVNVGVATCLMVGTLVILMIVSPRYRPQGIRLGLGMTLGFSLVPLALSLQGSLGDYWQQSVVEPLQWSQRARSSWNTGENLLRILREQLFLLISLAAFVILQFRARSLAIKIFVVPVACFLVVQAFLGHHTGSSFNSLNSIFDEYPWARGTNFFLHVCLISTLFLLPSASLSIWRLARRNPPQPKDLVFTYLLLIALGALVQIFPTWDARHIWWGLPAAVAALVWKSHTFVVRRSPVTVVAALGAALLLLSASIATNQHLSHLRLPHPTETSSAGMLSSPYIVLPLREELSFLQSHTDKDTRFIHAGRNFDLSSLFGSYRGHDKYFVNSKAQSPTKSRLEDRPHILVEYDPGPYLNWEGLTAFLNGTDYYIAARSKSLVLLKAHT